MRTNDCVRRFAVSAVALALLGIGGTAAADQTVVVDEDRAGAGGPNAFLFSSGLVMTGLSYTPALVVAINSDRSEDKYLYAPFAGPWLDLAARDGGDKLDRTLLVVDGVFQAIGGLQLIGAFVFTGDTTTTAEAEPTVVQAAVAPARLPGEGYGVVAVGRF